MPTSQFHTRGQALASCVSSYLGVKSTPEVISSCTTRSYFLQRKQSAKPVFMYPRDYEPMADQDGTCWNVCRLSDRKVVTYWMAGTQGTVNLLYKLYEPVSPTITGSAWYAVWTLTSGSRGNVSKLHICESDALVVLFGHWLTSIESDPLTVSLWAVNLPSGCKLMPAFLHSNGYTLVINQPLIWSLTRKSHPSLGMIWPPWTSHEMTSCQREKKKI